MSVTVSVRHVRRFIDREGIPSTRPEWSESHFKVKGLVIKTGALTNLNDLF